MQNKATQKIYNNNTTREKQELQVEMRDVNMKKVTKSEKSMKTSKQKNDKKKKKGTTKHEQ
jgi:hypothetical protein